MSMKLFRAYGQESEVVLCRSKKNTSRFEVYLVGVLDAE